MKNLTLGVHVSHNSSACLFENGRLIGAIQEERIIREKQYDGFPFHSIKYLMNNYNLSPQEINSVALAGEYQHIENPFFVYDKLSKKKQPFKSALSKLIASIKGRININFLDRYIYSKVGYEKYIESSFQELGFSLKYSDLRVFDHHECHAASAAFLSGYEEALVLTQDGRGDMISGTAFYYDGKLNPIHSQKAEYSVAQLYAGVTKFLGFTPLKHEGKITGLAAYGKRTNLKDRIVNLFEINSDGSIERKNDQFQYYMNQLSRKDKILINANNQHYRQYELSGQLFQKWLNENSKGHSKEDVACAIQEATEEIILKSIICLLGKIKTKSIKVCLAGGIFANVKLNQRIRELDKRIDNVFVQPAMGDEGLAIGAGLLCMNEQNTTFEELKHVYLGSEFSNENVLKELKKWTSKFEYEYIENIEKLVATKLSEGYIVGRFRGAMEFGPRALGNRSILIHPSNKEINNIVNKRLKRTEFMPFAPSCLDYRMDDYFKGFSEHHKTAERMTITYDVYENRIKEIDAVVHIDKTARPQMVTKQVNPSFYELINEFNSITGIGSVVNTSFNMHEEPIVNDPYDAMRAFDMGSVDYLAIENYFVKRK